MFMNYFKNLLAIVTFFFTVVFVGNSVNNHSMFVMQKKQECIIKNQSFMVFPELRDKPIKWYDSISENKIKSACNQKDFVMTAHPGEYYVYQLGVKALTHNLKNVQIIFSDLKGEHGERISTSKMTCFNEGGINFKGIPFSKEIEVPVGHIQALWVGIDLNTIKEGNYTGLVSVIANDEKQVVRLLLKVSGKKVLNHGYNEGSRLSRLNWLNSTVGINEEVTKGYIPVKVEGHKISILGRTLNIAKNGLPASITSYFDASNQSLIKIGEPIVSHPFRFVVEKENGEIIRLNPGKLIFTKQTPSKIVWSVLNTSNVCNLECVGKMEFDGFVDYRLKLTTKVPLKVKDIRLEIPVAKDKATYMMGLGKEGGFRPPVWNWKWDISKDQDMLWVGAVNGGLRIKWKAENYVRPLVNIYYKYGQLKMPPSWGNEGKGGVKVGQENSEVLINAYSGSRVLRSGEELNYDFELLITPFKLIDRQIKFGDRYYQSQNPNTSVMIGDAKKAGANIINIHQGTDIYPFINYPYLDSNVNALTNLVAEAHKENMRMKIYYTTRELTVNLPEFWTFNSLNGEVIFPGPGNTCRTVLYPKGPNEWFIKNLREKYIPAWDSPLKEGKFKGDTDYAVITTPDSRLNNFYIAGLDWMCQNIGIDGIYIDDSALDRFTLRRARKIIDRYRPEGRMDLHSWNPFNQSGGYASSLNYYMDLLPYLDMVWIGEGRDYNRSPDYWLIEISGIPFGITGQMLEGGGNPWRGMVYGITTRAGWTINPPTELWKFWDVHKIKDKIMIGYWGKDCPIISNNTWIKASIYKSANEAIIAVGNWSGQNQEVSLKIDWAKLGFDPSKFKISIPEIKDFQSEQSKISLDKITIPGGKGYLILLNRNK
jgi:hypothetical protein